MTRNKAAFPAGARRGTRPGAAERFGAGAHPPAGGGRRAVLLSATLATAGFLAAATLPEMSMAQATHPYVGMWVTEDGRIRHELLPNGRYDEARGTRESAYRGRYEVTGTHIEYWDDTGFTADGDFVDLDTLHHGGMIFRRRR